MTAQGCHGKLILSVKDYFMNRTYKKALLMLIVSIIVSAILSISCFAVHIANTGSRRVTVGNVTYLSQGISSITVKPTTNYVEIRTLSKGLPVEKYLPVDILNVGWQLVNNKTNQNIGSNNLETVRNATAVVGTDSTPLSVYPSIIVYGNHSAYKNGQTLLSEYTFNYI